MPTKIIGTAPYQVPRNSDLGSIATQDLDNVNIQGGSVTLGASATQGYFQNTDVSDVKPSLMMDFANGKTLDPRVAFSRSTTGTYYSGAVVKAEENLLRNTQDITSSLFFKTATLVYSNGALGYDGSNTAFVIGDSPTSTTNYYFYQDTTVKPSTTYTASFYAKSLGATWIWFNLVNPSVLDNRAFFNVSAGTTGNVAGTVSTSITSVGGGWYKITSTMTTTASQTTMRFEIGITTADNTITTYAGDYSRQLAVWGQQLEERSFATAYVPTSGTAVTNYIPQLVTAAANIPRLDNDPVTLEPKGLLIEEARTNIYPRSNYFDGSTHYVEAGGYINNATIAPDGSNTAAAILESTTYYCRTRQDITGLGNGATYTYSAYVKAGTRKFAQMQIYSNATNVDVVFDLVNGTYTTAVSGGVTAPTITPVGNGWYRCSITATIGSTTGLFFTYPSHAGGYSYDHTSGVVGIYYWGGQVEQAVHATSYIPTSGSSVTRAADNASMSGSNFSSWYNHSEGSVYVEAAHILNTAVDKRILEITNAAADFRQYDFRTNSTNIACLQLGYGISGSDTAAYGVISANTYFKTAVASGSGSAQIVANGALGIPISVPRMFSNVDTMYIGNHGGSGYYLNGWMKKLAFYPKRLSNAELAEITL